MSTKYVLCPGMVVSEYDGEEHYISRRALINLYRVNPRECIDGSNPQKLRGYSKEQLRKFIYLRPQKEVEDYRKFREERLKC